MEEEEVCYSYGLQSQWNSMEKSMKRESRDKRNEPLAEVICSLGKAEGGDCFVYWPFLILNSYSAEAYAIKYGLWGHAVFWKSEIWKSIRRRLPLGLGASIVDTYVAGHDALQEGNVDTCMIQAFLELEKDFSWIKILN